MSAATDVAQKGSAQPTTGPEPTSTPLVFHQSESFAGVLRELRASLWVTTYQAQQLLVMRAVGNGVSMLVRTFDKPMGLAVDARRMVLGTRDRGWLFRNAPDIATRPETPSPFDACYLPRSCPVTGDIAGHELCWAGDELWIVNTRFSCLCTLHADYSFVPRWQPRSVSALAAGDRCHLNGLAMGPGEKGLPTPRYVTALADTDVPEG